jgi:hypothetical protein
MMVLKKYFSVILISLLFFPISAHAQIIRGQIVDSESQKPLAFVNIVTNTNRSGSVSDIDGRFNIQLPEGKFDSLLFSYVGYEKMAIAASALSKNMLVELKRNTYNLDEVIILPGENPADRIIYKVIENRDKNNPEKLKSYAYTSYNKLFFTVKTDSLYKNLNDINFKKTADDSLEIELQEFLGSKHLFMMETVTEKKFMKPDKEHEKVLASRTSGLKSSSFSFIATQFQSFSFYNDYVSLLDKNYLNPLSKNSPTKYLFIIEDTLFSGADSIYVLSFRPKKGKNFLGMKGLLYIHTDGYAVQNVLAEPDEKSEKGIHVSVMQQYEKQGNAWFPVQLNTDLEYNAIQFDGRPLLGVGRSYLRDIQINPELSKKDFSEIVLSFDDDMDKKRDAVLEQYRDSSLDEKEANTYHFIDSIGADVKLDQKLLLFESLIDLRLPYKFIDIDLSRILRYNNYEGFRLGLGVWTNDKVSKYFSIGTYAAYGFKDKSWKYGAEAFGYLYRKKDIRLGIKHHYDVFEAGGMLFDIRSSNLAAEPQFRNLLISRMDIEQRTEIYLNGRFIPYFTTRFFAADVKRNFTGGYTFLPKQSDANPAMVIGDVMYQEVGFSFKYAYKERFIPFGKKFLSQGTNYPILSGRLSKGIGYGNPTYQLDFIRLEAMLDKSFLIRNIGRSNFRLMGGKILGDAPYSLVFNGLGSYDRLFGVFAINSFQTMRMNEFASDEFVYLFHTHNFHTLLYKGKKFQPKIVITNAVGFGRMSKPLMHSNIAFRQMDKGFFESGLFLNDIFRSNLSSLGFGVVYRYGGYSYPTVVENLGLRLSSEIKF